MAGLYVPANTLGGMAHLHGESGEEQITEQEHRQFLHQGPFLKYLHKGGAKRYNTLFQVSKFYVEMHFHSILLIKNHLSH